MLTSGNIDTLGNIYTFMLIDFNLINQQNIFRFEGLTDYVPGYYQSPEVGYTQTEGNNIIMSDDKIYIGGTSLDVQKTKPFLVCL